MRVFAHEYPDPGRPGRRSHEVHGVQCVGGRGAEEWYVYVRVAQLPVVVCCGAWIASVGGDDLKALVMWSWTWADYCVSIGIKEYSDWPTIPQLYVDKEFVGGCDILVNMHKDGTLAAMLAEKKLIVEAESEEGK